MMKHDWLIAEAQKWIGTHESAPNRGAVVDHFIKETGGALGTAWCVSWARFCADQVDKRAKEIFVLEKDLHEPNVLYKTQSTQELWDKSPELSRSLSPVPGYIAVWRQYNKSGLATGLGHCGIVTRIIDGGRWFSCIEGNTHAGGIDVSRDGDGVHERTRSVQGSPNFRFIGCLDPWYKPQIMP